MRKLPPLNALRSFEAAARHLNFSAAANELCVTHGAVSHQMRQLEDWFGRALFERHAAGVTLTSAGLALQQAASQALSLIENRSNEIRASTDKEDIVLGAPGSFLANWLIPRLEQFESANPDLRIRLQTSSSDDDLLKARLDALISTGRSWPANIAATPLFDEAIGPVCAPDFARLDQMSDLIGQALLQTSSRPRAWVEWAQKQGLAAGDFAQARQFDHLPLLLEAAAAGLGIAIAPALLVEREIAQGRLIAPFGFTACDSVFALCISASRTQEAPLRRLREWLYREAGLESLQT
jgi:DNA-binding transcriptional LysR family regulator